METSTRIIARTFYSLLRSTRNSKPSCRCYSTSKRQYNREAVGAKPWQNPEKETGYLLLVCPLTAFGLGCWQVHRRNWKLNLIQELEERTTAEPVPLPDDLDDLKQLEYKKVKVRGQFDHSRELHVMPRPSQGDRKSSGLKGHDSGIHVVTPFKLSDRDLTILVNRGWVPRGHIDPASRPQGQVNGEIELTGVVRRTEPRQPFAPHNMPEKNQWYHRDVEAMGQYVGSEPYFVDADAGSTVFGGPLGGQTRVSLRNEHLSYIFTWYTLAAFTMYMWWRRYGPPLRSIAR